MKQKIKHVFFDLDHTLWHFDANALLAYKEVFTALQLPVNAELFWEAYRPLNEKLWAAYRNDVISLETLRSERLVQSFAAVGYDYEPKHVDTIADMFIERLPNYTQLLEGALELLDYLQPRYQLHIITNGFREVQQNKLRNSGLLDYFATVTDSECCGYKKPNPHIFEFALNAAGAARTESLMIGDCIEADVHGALQCGIEAFWYRPGPSVVEDSSVPTITHLKELKNYL